jgi:hypothetical protein
VNCSPTRANQGQTPEEKFSKVKLDLSSLKVFGCLSYVHLRKEMRDKLEACFVRGIYLGIDEVTKGYRIFNPETDKVIITRDVVFDETKLHSHDLKESTFDMSSLSPLFELPITHDCDDSDDEDARPPSMAGNSPIHLGLEPSDTYTTDAGTDNDPYRIEALILTQLPKGNFMPYQSVLDDIDECPLMTRLTTLIPSPKTQMHHLIRPGGNPSHLRFPLKLPKDIERAPGESLGPIPGLLTTLLGSWICPSNLPHSRKQLEKPAGEPLCKKKLIHVTRTRFGDPVNFQKVKFPSQPNGFSKLSKRQTEVYRDKRLVL